MSPSPHIDAPFAPLNYGEQLGSPLTREDIIPSKWIAIVQQAAYDTGIFVDVVFVGFVMTEFEVDDHGFPSLVGAGFGEDRSSYRCDLRLTEAGIIPVNLPRHSTHTTYVSYALPEDLRPWEHEVIAGRVVSRWLLETLSSLQTEWAMNEAKKAIRTRKALAIEPLLTKELIANS